MARLLTLLSFSTFGTLYVAMVAIRNVLSSHECYRNGCGEVEIFFATPSKPDVAVGNSHNR